MPTLRDLDWPLRTPRLLVRPSHVGDAEALYAVRTHPAVAPWTHSVPVSLPQWRERYADPATTAGLLTMQLGGEIAGELMIEVHDADAHREVGAAAARTVAELGWLVAPQHQGQGLATEAARALLDLSFGPLGVRRAVASTTE
ncbi:MAG: N-acetyltransferase, partial [Marmoricola sp.]|nr:N-acetyltransferase [Marmoricola sp.]